MSGSAVAPPTIAGGQPIEDGRDATLRMRTKGIN